MIPPQWRSAAMRLKSLPNVRLTTRFPSPLAARCRSTYLRPRTALQRVQSPTSHVQQCKRPFSSRSGAGTPLKLQADLQNAKILESRFPRKTVLFLAIISGLAYYFVELEPEDWTDDVLASYRDLSIPSAPLQFINSKEDADTLLQLYNNDPRGLLDKPEVLKFFSEQFHEVAFGWEMEQEDAIVANMPVTHGCRYKSNLPCEDYHALGTAPGPGSLPWNYWSIMDGHAGHETAARLQWLMIPTLSSTLANMPRYSSSYEIESTIKKTFLQIDKSIMERAHTVASWSPAANAAAMKMLFPALSGSCALMAAFDPQNDILRVACTGDSRAVLGRWDDSTQSYTTIPLSVDQTGFNEAEVARLAAAHPDEPDIIDPKTGRLLGIAVTRAFGDHRWKWDNDFIKSVQAKFWGTAPRPGSKTPPYMTAEPEVTETQVVRADPSAPGQRNKSDFMIMASDGLWDRISSEHAVECVQRWLEARDRGSGSVIADPHLLANPPVFNSSRELDHGVHVDAERGEEVDWKAEPQYFAIEDENAAICLTRNAMGGTRRALFFGLLTLPPPFSRTAVDDTTVMVVFFDRLGEAEQQKVGKKSDGGKSWWQFW